MSISIYPKRVLVSGDSFLKCCLPASVCEGDALLVIDI
jgi:hypothetical protein